MGEKCIRVPKGEPIQVRPGEVNTTLVEWLNEKAWHCFYDKMARL
mgnify:CR=1 FL=1